MENRVRQLRKEYNETMQDIANIADISVSNLGSIERNETTPSATIAIQLARHFNVSVEYLMGLSDDRKQQDQPTISVLASLKGDKLEAMKKISDLNDDELHDLLSIIDILYKKK